MSARKELITSIINKLTAEATAGKPQAKAEEIALLFVGAHALIEAYLDASDSLVRIADTLDRIDSAAIFDKD